MAWTSRLLRRGLTLAVLRSSAKAVADAHRSAWACWPFVGQIVAARQNGTVGRGPGEIERGAVLAPVKGARRAPLRGAAHP